MLLKFRIVYYVPGDLTSEGEDLTFQGGDLIGGDLKVSGEDLFFGLRGGHKKKTYLPNLSVFFYEFRSAGPHSLLAETR